MYITKPIKTNTDALRALSNPFINCSMPGMNFKNLSDLKTLNTLNTSKKLILSDSIPPIKAINVGIDKLIKIKSNLFQLDLK